MSGRCVTGDERKVDFSLSGRGLDLETGKGIRKKGGKMANQRRWRFLQTRECPSN